VLLFIIITAMMDFVITGTVY